MKRTILAAACVLAFGVAAFAQQGAPPTAAEQALGGKLMEEINANVSLRTELIKAQAQLKTLQEENIKLRNSTKAEAPK